MRKSVLSALLVGVSLVTINGYAALGDDPVVKGGSPTSGSPTRRSVASAQSNSSTAVAPWEAIKERTNHVQLAIVVHKLNTEFAELGLNFSTVNEAFQHLARLARPAMQQQLDARRKAQQPGFFDKIAFWRSAPVTSPVHQTPAESADDLALATIERKDVVEDHAPFHTALRSAFGSLTGILNQVTRTDAPNSESVLLMLKQELSEEPISLANIARYLAKCPTLYLNRPDARATAITASLPDVSLPVQDSIARLLNGQPAGENVDSLAQQTLQELYDAITRFQGVVRPTTPWPTEKTERLQTLMDILQQTLQSQRSLHQ